MDANIFMKSIVPLRTFSACVPATISPDFRPAIFAKPKCFKLQTPPLFGAWSERTCCHSVQNTFIEV